jgi:hypothetical protein
MQRWFNAYRLKNIKQYINKINDKNRIIISLDVNKIQHPFMIKSPEDTKNRRSIPQHNAGHI